MIFLVGLGKIEKNRSQKKEEDCKKGKERIFLDDNLKSLNIFFACKTLSKEQF